MPAPDPRLDSLRCLSADEALSVCGASDTPPPAALRSHIEVCERCRVLVAEAARALIDVSGQRTGSLQTLSEGEQVAGRYRVVRFIARGGMGEVYEAFDQVLQEAVALKDAHRHRPGRRSGDGPAGGGGPPGPAGDPSERLSHPRVRLPRARELEGRAAAFLTMELLAGERLSQRLAREGPLAAEGRWTWPAR
jgi:hypothetical protein